MLADKDNKELWDAHNKMLDLKESQLKSLQSQNEIMVEAIKNEPELPGEMPEEMFQAIKNDKDAITELLRASVRATKKNILYNATFLQAIQSQLKKNEAVEEMKNYIIKQKPLIPEFGKIINQEFWNLI